MGGPSSLIWIIAISVTAFMVIVHVAIWFGIKRLGKTKPVNHSENQNPD